MATAWEVVVASSDSENRRHVTGMLARQGVLAVSASNVHECHEIFSARNIGLVFCDRRFSDGDYRDILAAACCPPKKAPKVVMMSADLTSAEYQQAKSYGIFDIISMPCRPTLIEWMITVAKRADLIQKKTQAGST